MDKHLGELHIHFRKTFRNHSEPLLNNKTRYPNVRIYKSKVPFVFRRILVCFDGQRAGNVSLQ